jgi:aldehyde dehydrogenase
MKLDLFLNRRPVGTETYFEVRDPGNFSDVVGMVASATPKNVDEAVVSAHQAYRSWKNIGVEERVAQVQAAAAALEGMSDALARLLVREQGMLLRDTQRDVSNGIKTLKETASMAQAFLQHEEFEDEEALVRVQKVPRGVVAAIIPWNAPMGLTMSKVGPALVSGNTIVVKPSPFAPLAISLALQAMADHFPPGAINILHGDGEVGPALTRHPLVRKVSFTGGINTGKAVMAAAADTVKNIGLELGGNDPAIILDDAVPDEVVPHLLRGIFPRSGQVCYAVKRVYVPQALYAKFAGTLCEAVNQLQVGYGLDPRSTLAPVNNQNQFRFIRGLIERTRQGGADVHELGRKVDPDSWEKGYYLLPSVVTNIAPDAELVVGEQFGPIIPLIPYASEEEVLRMANGTEHGLGSSVWTRDFERGLRMAEQIEAGLTFVNSHARTSLGDRHMPFGGVKQSGIGRVRTSVGLAEYIEYHAISLNKKNIRNKENEAN